MYLDKITKDKVSFYESVDKKGRQIVVAKINFNSTTIRDAITQFCRAIDPQGNCVMSHLDYTMYRYDFIARAVCHEDDSYSFEIGKEIAYRKIKDKWAKEKMKAFREYSVLFTQMSVRCEQAAEGLEKFLLKE